MHTTNYRITFLLSLILFKRVENCMGILNRPAGDIVVRRIDSGTPQSSHSSRKSRTTLVAILHGNEPNRPIKCAAKAVLERT